MSTIGLKQGTVELHPYSADWASLFAAEKARLEGVIGQYVLDIQHIGSTSIPNMPAKPILDIGVAVQNFEAAAVCIAPLEALGYDYRGENGIPRRHLFVKGIDRTHHLHMNEITSRDWRITIAFRDYLRSHPDVAREYAALKRSLAQQFPTDRLAYTEGKAPFIQNILELLNVS